MSDAENGIGPHTPTGRANSRWVHGCCYRVHVTCPAIRRHLSWMSENRDPPELVASFVIVAFDPADASDRATHLARSLMHGREFKIDGIEQKCPSGTHRNEIPKGF